MGKQQQFDDDYDFFDNDSDADYDDSQPTRGTMTARRKLERRLEKTRLKKMLENDSYYDFD